MRRGVRATLLAGTLAAALLAGACSDDDGGPEEPAPAGSTAPAPAYDPSLEASAAVLPLVPDSATVLTVTDFAQLRLQLGMPELSGEDPPGERAEFWRRVGPETAALHDGLLRPLEGTTARRYGFGQDDVLWEAHFGDAADDDRGWVIRFRDDLDMGGVRRAVDDGVGPLAGARVAAEARVIGTGVAASPEESWAADEDLVALVGAPAAATYVERGCVAFDEAYGAGVRDQLAAGPAADLGRLEELSAYSVAFGSDLATARLGADRPDAFHRARIADALPEGEPSFGAGFQRPVADPSSGRIGYSLGDPRVAVRLTLDRRLPFALCAD